MRRLDQAEMARQQLAGERDRAIESLNGIRGQLQDLAARHEKVRRDMVTWMVAFMLTNNLRSVIVDKATLVEANSFVLQRSGEVGDTSTVWRIVPAGGD